MNSKCEIDSRNGLPAKRRRTDKKYKNSPSNCGTRKYYSSSSIFREENEDLVNFFQRMTLSDIQRDYFDVVSSEPSGNRINIEEMRSNDNQISNNKLGIPTVFCENMYDKIFLENIGLNLASVVSDKSIDLLSSTILREEEAITAKMNNNMTGDVRQNSCFSERHSNDNMTLLQDNTLEIQKNSQSQHQFLRNKMPIIESDVQTFSLDNTIQNSIPVIKDLFNEKSSTVGAEMDTENLLANYMLFGPNALNILPIFHNEDEKVNIEKSDNICELTNKSNERKSIIETEREERNANGEILENIADINNESKLEKIEISDENEMTEALEQGSSRYNTMLVPSDHNSPLKTAEKSAWPQLQLHDNFMSEMQTKRFIESKNTGELITTGDRETEMAEATEQGLAKYSAMLISSDSSSFKTTEGSTLSQQELEDNFMLEMQTKGFIESKNTAELTTTKDKKNEMAEATEQGSAKHSAMLTSSDDNSSFKTTEGSTLPQQQLEDNFISEMQTKGFIESKNIAELITTKDKETEMAEAIEQDSAKHSAMLISSDNSSFKTTEGSTLLQQQLEDNFMSEMQTKGFIESKNTAELITTKNKENEMATEQGSAKHSAMLISSNNASFKTTEENTLPQQQLEHNFMPEMQSRAMIKPKNAPKQIAAGDKEASALSNIKKQPKASKRKSSNSQEVNQELHYNIVLDLIKEYRENTKLKEFTFHDITNFIMQRMSDVNHFKVLHAIRIVFMNEYKSGHLKCLGRNYTFGYN